MTTVGSYEVLEGKQRIFESAFAGLLNAMREDAAHVRSALYRDADGLPTYLVVSEWRTAAGLRAFLRSARFVQLTAWALEQVLARPPTHRLLVGDRRQRPCP